MNKWTVQPWQTDGLPFAPVYGAEKEPERIVVIVYDGLKPFSVFTADDKGYVHEHDCNWSKKFGLLCLEQSGGGGYAYVHGQLKGQPKSYLWVEPGFPVTNGGVCDGPALSPAELRAMGYRLLRQPLQLLPGVLSPFNDRIASEGRGIYCPTCDDTYPNEYDLCEHVVWCEECGAWVTWADHLATDGNDGGEPPKPLHCCKCGKAVSKALYARGKGLCAECEF